MDTKQWFVRQSKVKIIRCSQYLSTTINPNECDLLTITLFALISGSSRTFNFLVQRRNYFYILNNNIPLSKPDYLLYYSKPYHNIKSNCNKLIFLMS